jgi:hypothetical protein
VKIDSNIPQSIAEKREKEERMHRILYLNKEVLDEL